MKDFLMAFQNRKVFQESDNNFLVVLRCLHIGEIYLPSGTIIASDPWDLEYAIPLKKNFPSGRYPIFLSVRHWDVAEEAAFAMVKISKKHPVKWESAYGYTEDGKTLGFTVDSARSIIVDADIGRLISKKWEDDAEIKNHFIDDLNKAMVRNNGLYSNLAIPEIEGGNLFGFQLLSDGAYPCYWGYDDNDEIVAFLLDFLIFNPADYHPWSPPEEIAPIPEGLDADFFKWLTIIGDYFGEKIIHREPIDNETIAYLQSLVGVEIPSDILRYYSHCSPWKHATEERDYWRTCFEKYRDKLGHVTLPIIGHDIIAIILNAENYVIESLEWADHLSPPQFSVYHQASDLYAFFLTYLISVFDFHKL